LSELAIHDSGLAVVPAANFPDHASWLRRRLRLFRFRGLNLFAFRPLSITPAQARHQNLLSITPIESAGGRLATSSS
jgi:hypothetical protein